MSSIRSASSSTQMRTRSRRRSFRCDEVDQPAGRGDHDVGMAGSLRLRSESDAAVDRGDPQTFHVGDRAELLGDLARELSGRRQDQRIRAPAAGRQPLDDGHRERECLPEPVRERASTSRPASASRRTRDWIGNGSRIPRIRSASTTGRETPSVPKFGVRVGSERVGTTTSRRASTTCDMTTSSRRCVGTIDCSEKKEGRRPSPRGRRGEFASTRDSQSVRDMRARSRSDVVQPLPMCSSRARTRAAATTFPFRSKRSTASSYAARASSSRPAASRTIPFTSSPSPCQPT